jgi:APA family basic amino acid/polyamine antiporter
MFVAYTGYGRIATLGEEVRDPVRSIPRAMILTLALTAGIYALVAFVAVSAAGAEMAALSAAGTAPLEAIASGFGVPFVAVLVAFGAVTAMLGVLLNLVLGLSRVVLAMARRGDLPARLSNVNTARSSPVGSVWLVGLLIAGLASIGSVRTTWSFSAFTVLVYYAITNWAALRLPAESKLYPPWISWAGLICCLGLAFWVEPAVWATGVGLLGVGLGWHGIRRRALQASER